MEKKDLDKLSADLAEATSVSADTTASAKAARTVALDKLYLSLIHI